jgi:hypothetical protein
MSDAAPPPLEKNRGGRPRGMRRLSPAKQQELIGLLKRGEHLASAAAFVGVATKTVYLALAEGARMEEAGEKGWQVGFLHAVNAARAEAEIRYREHVRLAAEAGEWRAATWWLEHGPAWERWCDKSKVKVEFTGHDVDAMMTQMGAVVIQVLTERLGDGAADAIHAIDDGWTRLRASAGRP